MFTVPNRLREGAISLGYYMLSAEIIGALSKATDADSYKTVYSVAIGIFAGRQIAKEGKTFTAIFFGMVSASYAFKLLRNCDDRFGLNILLAVSCLAAVVFECFTKNKNAPTRQGSSARPGPANLEASASRSAALPPATNPSATVTATI